MKGYKIFNPDFTCQSNGNKIQYKENETFEVKLPIAICGWGLHFCQKASDCFSYYSFDPNNVVCEAEALGEIKTHNDDSKVCTNILRIGRRLTWQEVLVIANQGKDNTGHSNSGDSNSGNWNSGDRNSGNRNSGDSNSGNWNSGNWNSGDRNSGDSNSGYRNSGAFCLSSNPKLFLFDKITDIDVRDWENSEAVQVMNELLETTMWVPSSNMTKEEKERYPKHETTDGYLKTKTLQESWKDMWGNLSEEKKQLFLKLPNFDAIIFYEITGIQI